MNRLRTEHIISRSLLLTLLFWGLLWYLRAILTPFFLAFLLAYILDPVIQALEKKKFSRNGAIIFLLTFIIFLLVIIALTILPETVKQLKGLASQAPGLAGQLYEQVPEQWRHRARLPTTDEAWKSLQRLSISPRSLAQSTWQGLMSLGSGAFGVFSFFSDLIIFCIAAFYFLRDFHPLIYFVHRRIPMENRVRVEGLCKELDKLLRCFFRGQLLICLILGVLFTLGLGLFGIPFFLPIGFLSGFLNIIPYVGTGLGLTLSLLVALFPFHGWWPALAVILVFVVIQTFQDVYLSPKILGESVGLHPLVIIFSLMVFGKIFGMLGLLLAIPLACFVKVFLRNIGNEA